MAPPTDNPLIVPPPERWAGYVGKPTRAAGRYIRSLPDMPYSDDAAREFIAHIAAGRSLADVCRTPGLPDAASVRYWRAESAEFDAAVIQALEDRADMLIALAEDAARDEENAAMLTAKVNAYTKLAGMRSARYRPRAVELTVNRGESLDDLSDADLERMVAERRAIQGEAVRVTGGE